MPKVKLTKTVIASLPTPPKGKRVTYTDSELPGFTLRLGADGGTYYAVKRDPVTKKVIYSPIGTMTLMTPAAAREEALIKLRDIHSAQLAKQKILLGDQLVERYLKEHAAKKKDQGKADRYRLEREFLPAFGKRDVRTIRRSELASIINRIGNEEGHATAARLMKAVFSKLFNFAVVEELVDVSPAYKLPKFKGKEGTLVLTDKEVGLIWLHLEKETRLHIRTGLRLCMLTGQRRSEVATAEWEDVDLENRLWTIPAHKTKNGLSQTVPLNELAYEQFRQMHALTGRHSHVFWVFKTKQGWGPLHPDTFTRAVTEMHIKGNPRHLTGTRKFKVHNFRHTVGTRVAELTEDRGVVKHVLNHKEPGATHFYDKHTYDGVKKKALLLWEQRLLSAVGSASSSPVPA